MCLGTFSRLARSLATIYIFARVRIFGTSVPFYVTGNSPEFPVITSENTLREFPLVIATVAKVSRKRGLWLVVRVNKKWQNVFPDFVRKHSAVF